jgi:hypothetical protein
VSIFFSVKNNVVRGDQEGLFKLVTLDRILNRITGVTSDSWWLVVVNAIPISDICQINQQNVFSCSVINNRIKKFSQLYCQLKQSFLITRYFKLSFNDKKHKNIHIHKKITLSNL